MPTRRHDDGLPFLVGPALRQRLDLTLHLVEFGRQTIIVLGPRGSGRTRVLEALEQDAPNDWQVVVLDGAVCVRETDLIAALARELGQPETSHDIEAGEDGADANGALVAGHLETLAATGRRLIVFIDDGDGIDDAGLAFLNETFGGAGDAPTRFVITCTPESVCARAAIDGDASADTHVIELPVLEEKNVWVLADAWAGQRGVPREALVTADEEAEFFIATGGLPGAVLGALEARIDAPLEAPRAPPGWKVPPRVRTAAGVVVVILAAAGLLFLALDARREGKATGEPQAIEIALPKAAESPIHESDAPSTSVGDDDSETVAMRAADADAAPGFSPSGGTASVDIGVAPVSPATPNPIESMPAEPAVVSNHDDPDSTPSVVDPEPLATQKPQRVENPQPTGRDPQPAIVQVPAVDAPTPVLKPGRDELEKAEAESEIETDYGKWVLTQDDASYVIQVFGSKEREAAERFVTREGPPAGRAATIEVERDGAPWFVVVVGHYANRDAARAAIADLAANLRRHGPWARSVASLRD